MQIKILGGGLAATIPVSSLGFCFEGLHCILELSSSVFSFHLLCPFWIVSIAMGGMTTLLLLLFLLLQKISSECQPREMPRTQKPFLEALKEILSKQKTFRKLSDLWEPEKCVVVWKRGWRCACMSEDLEESVKHCKGVAGRLF